MSALSNTFQSLLEFLQKRGQVPPTRDVRIVEVRRGAVDERGRIRIQQDELRDLTEYVARFDELLAAGLPWINVSCYGVHRGKLIVGIEVPEAGARPASRVSLNYSGPTAAVLGQGWNAETALVVE